MNPANELMAVSVSGGGTWAVGPPKKVLNSRYFFGEINNVSPPYDVSPDGTRFLMMKVVGNAAQARLVDIIVVRNWFEELRRLAPLSR